MKLRTSFFNPAVFKKDLLRFWPIWCFYTVLGLIYTISMSGTSLAAPVLVRNIFLLCSAVSALYVLICVRSLMGDLYSTRLCGGIHSLPVRRECLLTTHIVSCILFSLVPNLLILLPLAPNLGLWGYFTSLGIVALQHLFYMGLAFFSALCAGTGFAMIVLYGTFNLLPVIAGWILNSMFLPLLPGVTMDFMPFIKAAPAAAMLFSDLQNVTPEEWYHSGIFGKLGLYAGFGLVFLALSYLLYRRRKLECAGSFLSLTWLKPLLLLLVTGAGGCFFRFFFCEMMGMHSALLFVLLGCLIGCIAGEMILSRTARIFRKKSLISMACILLVLAAALGLTRADLTGSVRRIPETDEISEVSLYGILPDQTVSGDSTEAVQLVRELHGQLIREDRGSSAYAYGFVSLHYELKDGTVLNRKYAVPFESSVRETVTKLSNLPSQVFSPFRPEDLEEGLNMLQMNAYYLYDADPLSHVFTDPAERTSLVEAMLRDAEEGHLQMPVWEKDEITHLDLFFGGEVLSLTIYPEAVHTVAWLEEHVEGARDQLAAHP